MTKEEIGVTIEQVGTAVKLSVSHPETDEDLLPDYDDRMVSVADIRRALGISMPTSGPLFDLLTKAER